MSAAIKVEDQMISGCDCDTRKEIGGSRKVLVREIAFNLKATGSRRVG